jgi:outer membrane protein
MHPSPLLRPLAVLVAAALIPAASAQQTTLTLAQATELAIKNNLQTVLGRERILQARGERGVTLSSLLPNLSASASQVSQTSNLAALGLSHDIFPGVPTFIGPYSVFDARIRLTQTIFNLASLRRYQAGRFSVTLAAEQQRFATQQVVTASALAYLAVLEAEQAVSSANANVQLAQSLLDLATSQRHNGVATGLDVARAETRLAAQQVQLAQTQTALGTARLDLARIVGAPLAGTIVLAEPMRFAPEAYGDRAALIQTALSERSDLKVAGRKVAIAKVQRQAALAGWAPSVSVGGDYGSSAIKPNDTNFPTRSVGIRVEIPVFDGGRTRSEVQVAASLERQAEAQLNDLKAAIEKDVRQALDTLATREVQVKAAQKALSLATRELELSQDRFKNGVADNIEVVNAQTALENARQVLVTSLAQFNIARLNLASATGRAQDFRL